MLSVPQTFRTAYGANFRGFRSVPFGAVDLRSFGTIHPNDLQRRPLFDGDIRVSKEALCLVCTPESFDIVDL